MRCLFITSFGQEGHGHITRCVAISQAFDKLKIKNFTFLNPNSLDNDKLKEMHKNKHA